MSGHSKWSKIKRAKAVQDVKKSKIFTKYIKEITIAARLGGGDPSGNARLRMAIEKARAASLPRDVIDRSVKRGSGEIEGAAIEEVSYEGYGPSGVAMIVDCTTDNKVRTVAEVRLVFSKRGGHMGESGAVAWMFEKKGQIVVDPNGLTEDEVMEKALDAGADDVRGEGDVYIISTSFADFHHVNENLTRLGLTVKDAEIEMLPKNTVAVTDLEAAQKLLGLIEALEDNEDVQNVWANYDIADELMEKL